VVEYPEIAKLQELKSKHGIQIRVTDELLCNRNDLRKVVVTIKQRPYSIYVNDEYQDLAIDNPDLHLCLLLRSLEDYKDSQDFLTWCQSLYLDPCEITSRQHHMDLNSICARIESHIGTIDSFVSNSDFELNSGAAQKLRESLS
jgi:hypothetical protein